MRLQALRIHADLQAQLIPSLVTAQEASWICDDYLLTESKYHTMRASTPVRLIDVSVYLARYAKGAR
jgi:uncharacterized membrane protein